MSLEVSHDGIVRKATGDDRFYLRLKGHKLDDGLLTAHPTRDRQIQDDDIERLTGLSRSSIQRHRLRTVFSQGYVVSAAAQHLPGKLSDWLLIIHDQNPALAGGEPCVRGQRGQRGAGGSGQ